MVCVWSIYVASEGTTRDRRTMRLARYQLRSSRLGGARQLQAHRTTLSSRRERVRHDGRQRKIWWLWGAERLCLRRRAGEVRSQVAGARGGNEGWTVDPGSLGEGTEIVDARGGQGRCTRKVVSRGGGTSSNVGGRWICGVSARASRGNVAGRVWMRRGGGVQRRSCHVAGARAAKGADVVYGGVGPVQGLELGTRNAWWRHGDSKGLRKTAPALNISHACMYSW